jgi:hypothetical protein
LFNPTIPKMIFKFISKIFQNKEKEIDYLLLNTSLQSTEFLKSKFVETKENIILKINEKNKSI